jgi:hypothetical protein
LGTIAKAVLLPFSIKGFELRLGRSETDVL